MHKETPIAKDRNRKDDVWTQPDWLNTVQAFMVLGVLCNSLVIAGIFAALAKNQEQNVKLIGFGLFLTFLFCITGVSLFTPNSRVSLKVKEFVSKDKGNSGSVEVTLSYGWSYILAWIGTFVALAGSVLGWIQTIKENINYYRTGKGNVDSSHGRANQQQNGGVEYQFYTFPSLKIAIVLS